MILSCSVYFTQPVALTLKMESAGEKWQAELLIYQPTFGDNSAARNRESAQQQGNWWIGGAENRPSESISPGGQHPDGSDAPNGTITSPWFRIVGENISFLIGGRCNVTAIRAELIVNNQVSTIELITFFLYFNSSFFFVMILKPSICYVSFDLVKRK